ncbi:hypothetical protein GCM10011511_11970 [Puia dinghuensis]|uniref:Uncharacterized protein n=1 Tax=Puia dinghuensis TaxID=1792502 RepID=A0A8J2XRT8_9BACT|nr:hypothetical protein GCM10011511_11970 [Puia dinghuensis]
MEKFLLLIREDLKIRDKMSPEEFNRNARLMAKWIESMAQTGNYLQAEPLLNGGRYVGRASFPVSLFLVECRFGKALSAGRGPGEGKGIPHQGPWADDEKPGDSFYPGIAG